MVDFNNINSGINSRADSFLNAANRNASGGTEALRNLEQQAELESIARSEYEVLQGISKNFWSSIFSSLRDHRDITNVAVG